MPDESNTAAAQGSPQAAAVASGQSGATALESGAAGAQVGDGQGAGTPPAEWKLDPVNLPAHYKVNDERMGKFTEFAKAKSLTQSEAQGLVDLFVESGADLSAAVEAQLVAQHEAQIAAWAEEAKADKDIGGANYEANLAVSQSAIGRFGPPEFKALLDAYGIGNHPAVIKTFLAIGKAISEGSHVSSTGAGQQRQTAEASIYNHPTSRATMRFGAGAG